MGWPQLEQPVNRSNVAVRDAAEEENFRRHDARRGG